MRLERRVRSTLKGLFLSATFFGAGMIIGSTSALADACTDLGNCVVYQGECWCQKDAPTTGAEVCGHPAGFTGTFYSLNGLESEHGCEDETNHTASGACPAVAGVADGARARAILMALGEVPNPTWCADGSDCDADCATNPLNGDGGWGSALSCWDNHARWNRADDGFVRCANVEVQVALQNEIAGAIASLAVCNGDLGTCSTDLGTTQMDLADAEAQLADADGDGAVDSRDACADTPAGAEVDARGCDIAQFCGMFDASQKDGRKGCKKADWMNDEPTQKGKERDCNIAKNGKGKADDTCVPASL